MAYQSWSVSFGEQPAAAKWNILGTNDAYFDSLVGSGTAWASWAPTYGNFSLGNGTLNYAVYAQIGKIVYYTIKITLGSTSSATDPMTISMPVTPSSNFTTQLLTPLGQGMYSDGGATFYPLIATYRAGTPNGIQPIVPNVSATYPTIAGFSGTVPVTIATGDVLQLAGFYEAA